MTVGWFRWCTIRAQDVHQTVWRFVWMSKMLTVIHGLIAFVCFALCVKGINNISGQFLRVVCFGTWGLIHGLVPLLQAIMGLPSDYQYLDQVLAGIFTLLVLLAIAGAWYLMSKLRQRNVAGISFGLRSVLAMHEGNVVLKRMFWATMTIGMTALVIMVTREGVEFTLARIFQTGRFGSRTLTGYSTAIVGNLVGFLCIAAFLGVLISRKYRIATLIIIPMVAFVFFGASGGSRLIAISLLGSLLFAHLARSRPRKRQVVTFALGGTLVLLLAIGTYELRKIMTTRSTSEAIQFMLTKDAYAEALTRDPLGYHSVMIAVVDSFPESVPFVNMATYRRILFFAFPYKYFPWLKPFDPNMTVSAAIRGTSFSIATVPPTIPGDLYINFWGWPGLLVAPLFGMFLCYVENKIYNNLLWFIVIGGTCVLRLSNFIRGAIYDTIIPSALFILICWVIIKFFGGPYYSYCKQAQQYYESERDVMLPEDADYLMEEDTLMVN